MNETNDKLRQIGNLAIICAGRSDVVLEIGNGTAVVCFGEEANWRQIIFDAFDEEDVSEVIHMMNHGELRKEVLNAKVDGTGFCPYCRLYGRGI